MRNNTTSTAAINARVVPNMDSDGSSAFGQCDDASCAFERMMILLDTTAEALRTANDEMPAGEGKDRAHYEVFCLLLLLHDNMKAHADALSRIQSSIVAERKAA